MRMCQGIARKVLPLAKDRNSRKQMRSKERMRLAVGHATRSHKQQKCDWP
ncbi:hypothetical protein [Moorena sp. SIO4A5]|nr:hypothetical protein [Moorena sp. SIO4A5]NEO19474.1 hypothetical protein [Moorena sp. SIO4A5]